MARQSRNELLATLEDKVGKMGFKIRMIMAVMPKYGANAKPLLPKLKEMARRLDFLLFEDRKFADIGQTVAAQYARDAAHWAGTCLVNESF